MIKLPKWNEKNTKEKVLFVLQIILSLVVIILASLSLFFKKDYNNYTILILGIDLLIIGAQCIKYNKKTAIIEFMAGAFVIICGIATIVMNLFSI